MNSYMYCYPNDVVARSNSR
ncbi:hypothetical protein BIW11_03262 [Tropilaelaps mercedesae]|uniref:Uncharacterized protein n=1 Tax=Tropilaelaps mercedesae TaxID=418985 RepID=A0A1V9XPJ5_9ACAR|nr:hypothetical protein BIW11_03262 [Tropilaelaps mercedesae]